MLISKINQEIPFIYKDNFRILFSNTKASSYDQNIKNWIKSGKIIPLKRGLYIFASYWNKCQTKDEYLNYLSSILYFPSYISKETVLARYGMLTESVYGISSVTTKVTRTFSSKVAVFTYCKIKKPLFRGFNEEYFIGNKYFVATKSKALFDYLYFYKRKMKVVNEQSVDELRINFDIMEKKDWHEFDVYIGLAKSNKMEKINRIIRKQYVS